ncbi:MAG: SAM-dependent methyltransferase [Bacteroidia bacterium]|nr:SAM-dependent methyltransferase [Bacteroidia bacterium]
MKHPASFRDSSGFVFIDNGEIYRTIADCYREHYEHLISSGLYENLCTRGLLISHQEVNTKLLQDKNIYKILKPQTIQFISYPYEWCFSQLKDAALCTLEIQKTAIGHGMTLKDASSFNIQFHEGRAMLIDSLSFEKYNEGSPWSAYLQFCEHFLAPLALMHYVDQRLQSMLVSHIHGIPLEMVSQMFPFRSRLHPGIYLHILLHSRFKTKYAQKKITQYKNRTISKKQLLGLIYSIESTVKSLKLKHSETIWTAYNEDNEPVYSESKKQIIKYFISLSKPSVLLDLGANNGEYSFSVSDSLTSIIAIDNDHQCIERFYNRIKAENKINMLPLVIDISNPSPSLGWRNKERESFIARIKPDMILCLALLHHLVISNHLQFEMLAEFFSTIAKWLIIEWIPEDDNRLKILTQNRTDDISYYCLQNFEHCFSLYFSLEKQCRIKNSVRILYLMKRKI